MPISPYFRLFVGKVEQMCVVLILKYITNETQTDPTSFGGSLGTSTQKNNLFFPATAIYGSLDSFRTTRLPCATKGQATNYDDADGSSCQHDLGQVNDFFTGQINEFLKWIQGPRRVLRLEDFPDFKRIVGDF